MACDIALFGIVSLFGVYLMGNISSGLETAVAIGMVSLCGLYLWGRRGDHVFSHWTAARVVPNLIALALNALSDGVLVLDRRGRIVLANYALLKALGRSQDDLCGLPADALPWTWEPQPEGTPA